MCTTPVDAELADIFGEADLSSRDLSLVSLVGELEVDLVRLSLSRGTHRVPLGLESTARVCWNLPANLSYTVVDQLAAFSVRRNPNLHTP